MKQLPAFFYALSSGRGPVRDWLKSLPADDRKIVGVGEEIKDIELHGQLACRCAVLLAGDYGKCVARLRRDESLAFCSASKMAR